MQSTAAFLPPRLTTYSPPVTDSPNTSVFPFPILLPQLWLFSTVPPSPLAITDHSSHYFLIVAHYSLHQLGALPLFPTPLTSPSFYSRLLLVQSHSPSFSTKHFIPLSHSLSSLNLLPPFIHSSIFSLPLSCPPKFCSPGTQLPTLDAHQCPLWPDQPCRWYLLPLPPTLESISYRDHTNWDKKEHQNRRHILCSAQRTSTLCQSLRMMVGSRPINKGAHRHKPHTCNYDAIEKTTLPIMLHINTVNIARCH